MALSCSSAIHHIGYAVFGVQKRFQFKCGKYKQLDHRQSPTSRAMAIHAFKSRNQTSNRTKSPSTPTTFVYILMLPQ